MSSPDVDAGAGLFPPARHILRDLGMEMETGPGGYHATRMPLVPEVLTPDGHVQVAVLATLADLAAATPTLHHVFPDWMATSDLTACVAARPESGPLLARPRVLRAGRTSIVTEVEIVDEGARGELAVGHSLLAFARIERPEQTRNLLPPDPTTERTRSSMARADSAMRRHHHEQTGLRITDAVAGVVELERSEYVLNSFGTVQGGSVATLAEAAAEALVGAATGKAASSVDVSVRYLAQGPRGPYRTAARLLRLDETRGQAWARVEVYDIGSETLMSLVKVALRLADAAPV